MQVVILPILVPMLTALTALFWGRPTPARRLFVAASALLQCLAAFGLLLHNAEGGALALGVGYWTYRVGIVLVIDLLASIMLSLSALVGLAALLYGMADQGTRSEHPLRLPLLQFLMMGINLSFMTGDLFNLFVAFEVMLIASYALLTLEADNWSVKQAYPYLAINLVGGTLFLCAAGLAYSLFGTLNMADIATRAALMEGDPRVTVLALLLAVVFLTKAGVFPLGYWLPNSYPTLPIPLAALYAGMLTKVGVYVLLRAFGTILPHDLPTAHQLLVFLACVTMVATIFGALARPYIRGILAFNILSHIGFMILAIGLFSERSLAAAIYYIMHHIVVMASLFLITGVAIRLTRTDDLSRMGGLWKQAPWFGLLFMIQALSLSGLPPLSGFWGKYLILEAALDQHAYLAVACLLIASILTLVSMLRIWNRAFWAPPVAPGSGVQPRGAAWVRLATIAGGLVVVSLVIGIGAEWFLKLSFAAAHDLMDNSNYIQLVFEQLGKGGR